MRKLIDPRGSVTQWKRATDGRVLEKIAHDGTKTSYSYQPRSGRLESVTRPNDQGSGHPTVTFTYTADGMTSLVDYHAANTPDASFSYLDGSGKPDPLGRMTSWTDSIGTTSYSYIALNGSNGAGQLYEQNGPLADDTIRQAYDWRGRGNLRQVRSDAGTVLHSSGVTIDSLGRLTQSVNELGTFNATYNPGNLTGKMNALSRPNGMSTQFDWYPANAGANALGLKEIHHSRAGTTVSKFGYEYDLGGRVSKWSRQLDASPANGKSWKLGYSRAGELTGLVETNALGSETKRGSWSYDPAGNWYAVGDSSSTTHRTNDAMNRLQKIGGAGRTVVEGEMDEAATVNVDGQPATVTGIPGTGDFTFRREIAVQEGANTFGITATDANGNKTEQTYSVQVGGTQSTYGYDLNGNLLWEKDPGGTVVRSFEWDGADRLKAVNWGAQRIEWTYSAMGQKVSESVNGTLSRKFHWDGVELLLQRSAAGVIEKKFYGDGELRVGGADAGSYFYTRDHLGSVREVVKQDGSLQARYDYDAYGKRTTITQVPAYLGGCDFGYTGHFTRAALVAGKTELVLAHYRAYDPNLGRWLSPDPLENVTGEMAEMLPEGPNLYAYVGNDPINGMDPLGLYDPFSPWGMGQYNAAQRRGEEWDPFHYTKAFARCVREDDEFREMTRPGVTFALGIHGGLAARGGLVALAPNTMYHFTSSAAAASIRTQGVINAGRGLFGKGVYVSAINSARIARWMGAKSTEVCIKVSTKSVEKAPTLIPSAYRLLRDIGKELIK
ncbi:RHS repeat domain-containing protein [Haloferula chungangensis]|uniref:RHS repeat domain-containing protein n=1 Tax=Haloferula chungangensis TaxID=1048331 RepID=A0ABW2L3E7_9BACT